MLKKIRTITAAISLTLLTLLFLDFTGLTHYWLRWLAKIQFLPAILALNAGVIIFLFLLTLLFGRIYCSVICPLGIYQDLISRITAGKKKNRYRYTPAISWLRYGMLGIFIIAFITGISAIISLLDPYATYGRIATNLFTPFYRWANNALVYLDERLGNYLLYEVEVWLPGAITFVVTIFLFLLVTLLAWRNGRIYCNTICPVGTLLGFISRFSVFKPVFVSEACNGCGLCARNCKASCIDSKNRTIDYSRCVTCMNCIEKCNNHAIRYIPQLPVRKKEVISNPIVEKPFEKAGLSRKSFLSLSAIWAVNQVIKSQEMHGDGGLAEIEDKKRPDRQTPIVPPGAQSARHMKRHCTACQLCVSACPSQILRPSHKAETFMQPEISYERGYCRPECSRCSEVCPTGAIHRITTAEKSAIQIGRAAWIRDLCVVNRDDVNCRACESHCSTQAILLVARDPDDPKSLKIPTIDNERCIGCGACENLCPARPLSAIYVEGNQTHITV